MIVKVAPGRRDGKTSFAQLIDYMTAGLEELGADPRMISFQNLTQYITSESTAGDAGDQVEKCIAVEIGNLSSLRNAAKEMWAVSHRNPRCQDPVFHYILSWPEHERPSVKDILAAARKSIDALGLSEHQYVIAVHRNTDNIHAHVEVNRIHPLTYKSHHLEWTHKTLHKAAREAEIEFGWSHDNGLWQVVEVEGGEKVIVPNNDYVERAVDVLSSKARDYELWSGQESFETYCKGEPAKALQKVLRTRPLTWQLIHQTLARYGIELKDTGGGGLRVELIRQHNEKAVAVAASKAFRFLKRKDLEQKIGPFQPLDPNLPAEGRIKTYKRDPVKRMTRRLERLAEREGLFMQYQDYRKEVIAERERITAQINHKERVLKRYLEMKREYLERRALLKRHKTISGVEKQYAYMILKASYKAAREELKEVVSDERRQIYEAMPKLKSWRAWVEEQAMAGNEAAISALRGMVYQDKRDAKKKEKEGEEVEENTVPAILPVDAHADDTPSIKPIYNLIPSVSSNGRVFYHFLKSEALAFIDEGRRLTFGRDLVDDASLEASLRYAHTKWGDSLKLAGGDEVFRERVMRLAHAMGITINNVRPAAPIEQPKPKVDLPAIAIAEKQRQDHPGAQIAEARGQGHHKGPIVAMEGAYALQKTGNDRYVIHQLAVLDKVPKVGQDIQIRYESNIGRVTPHKGRGR
jgi:hypothetical protein